MNKSLFFGGNPSVSHFTISPRYILPEEQSDPKAQRERRKAQIDKLKELGFKQPYFQFHDRSEEEKANALEKAQLFWREWSAKAGFELEITEGFFL